MKVEIMGDMLRMWSFSLGRNNGIFLAVDWFCERAADVRVVWMDLACLTSYVIIELG